MNLANEALRLGRSLSVRGGSGGGVSVRYGTVRSVADGQVSVEVEGGTVTAPCTTGVSAEAVGLRAVVVLDGSSATVLGVLGQAASADVGTIAAKVAVLEKSVEANASAIGSTAATAEANAKAVSELRSASEGTAALAASAAEVANEALAAVSGATAPTYVLTIESTNGTVFPSGVIETVLTARVFRGESELTAAQVAEAGTVRWYVDGTERGTGTTLAIAAGEIADNARVTARLEASSSDGGLEVESDGKGAVSVSCSSASSDGAGNVTLSMAPGVRLTSDGAGNVTMTSTGWQVLAVDEITLTTLAPTGSIVADTVTAAGTDPDTGWTWAKWASGAAECWKSFDTSDALANQYGSFYYNSYVSTLPFAFVEPPQPHGSVKCDAGLGFVCFDANTTTERIGFMLCSPVAESTGPKSVHLAVKGRWKQ